MNKLYYSDGSTYNVANSLIAEFETGGISNTNGCLLNSTDYLISRTKMYYGCDGNAEIKAVLNGRNLSAVSAVFYTSSHAFIEYRSISDLEDISFVTPNNCAYFKLVTSSTASSNEHIETAILYSTNSFITENYNPNIINQSIGFSTAFNYKVSRNAMASGRLLLPPNYVVDGSKVPLIVFVHGSGGMLTWDTALGATGGASYQPYLNYLANEGFAVFDCYPWTNKESVNSSVYSPVAVGMTLQSYIEGIKYVCDRFNVNIEKVSLLCKSQGGHIGHWAVTQTVFPFKTVSLFAPSTGLGTSPILFNANCRTATTKYVDFDGTENEISTFISSGLPSNSTVKSFLDKNKAKIVNLIPYAHGIANSSVDELYASHWQNLAEVPQWMIDEGLPSLPSGAITIYSVASHDNFVKVSSIPSKFWCSWDDNATSSYVNYAICRWLQNGGSDSSFRALPVGTGGHHAMDTDTNALKSSGTTALGISYSDIPTAYVEVVQFIRLKGGD